MFDRKKSRVLIYHRKGKLFKEKLLKDYPALLVREGRNIEEIDDFVEEAEIIICWKFPNELLKKAKKLVWMQLVSAGCDQIINLPDFPEDIILSTAGGVHTGPIAEYVICYILSICQNTFELMKFQREKKWGRPGRKELKDKIIGIIGLGNIGREIARKAKAFDMKVIGLKRNQEKIEYVDKVFPVGNMDKLLRESDFVTLAVPFTPATRNLIGKKELKKMKPSAYLINIARGEVLDERALIYALKNKEIGGAVLDVFKKEPLSEKSELWNLENIIITPHISWEGEKTTERVTEVIVENIGRYIKGEKVKNLVDFQRGY